MIKFPECFSGKERKVLVEAEIINIISGLEANIRSSFNAIAATDCEYLGDRLRVLHDHLSLTHGIAKGVKTMIEKEGEDG
ncbi:MAG: hypothetical protein KKB59_18450 [Spirochaetes bacterium]|nr:hypothetical protein [Spirochaetota bacterium]